MRKIAELTNAEKVQIHFMFREMKQGYVQIGRMYGIRPIDVPDVVVEVDAAKIDFEEREPVVYRRHYVNPKRGKTRKPTIRASHKVEPTAESLQNLLQKFNMK
ncbi:hypothetical protein OFDDKENP_00255 [Aeromonas phage B614]|nr:hypothetical protein OFDDKENP_00255 [Aeromonas phage B614]UYD58268.1 hypothetical protein JNEOFJEA_00189 [Aeromonas phage UP87]UYD58382.1 hypothetical protein IPAKJDPM_00039 [Aeromonas phage avDM14-QBC]UYD58598.1 hypothetical protein HNNIDBEH_00005 [Aeromonas phage avDM10-HWA]UYD59099.1 hypothetical protein OFOPOMKI_00249 [Aeromonas phage avDM7-IJDJ]UYD59911.1 hypothetical protein LEHPIFIF_00138 [Aeromonas phage avDM9-HANS]